MKIESRIHELNEMVQSEKLGPHAGLVTKEISFLGEISWAHQPDI